MPDQDHGSLVEELFDAISNYAFECDHDDIRDALTDALQRSRADTLKAQREEIEGLKAGRMTREEIDREILAKLVARLSNWANEMRRSAKAMRELGMEPVATGNESVAMDIESAVKLLCQPAILAGLHPSASGEEVKGEKRFPRVRDLVLGLSLPGGDLHFFKRNCADLESELRALLAIAAERLPAPGGGDLRRAAQAVVDAAGQMTDGSWQIIGDGELLISDLSNALVEPGQRKALQAGATTCPTCGAAHMACDPCPACGQTEGG